MDLQQIRAALQGVCAYKYVMEKPVMAGMMRLLDALCSRQGEEALDAYTHVVYSLWTEGAHSLGEWLNNALRYEENPYADEIARGEADPWLARLAQRDVATFNMLSELQGLLTDEMSACLGPEYSSSTDLVTKWVDWEPISFEELTDFYRLHGAGLFAKYRAFLWEEGQLHPVEQPDSPKPEELLGYEAQRQQVIANTKAMLDGHRVNNVLLFGDSGTGKSATVKSLLSLPGFESLRLIEVEKDGLSDMTRLIRTLRSKPQKFILFIDDLAFDQDDKVFSALKTILEGGLEPRPTNVAVYATSNRRHLVRQTFSERAGEEIDTFETIAEKTALSERFGLRVLYQNMDKKGYLALVDHLAAREGIEMEKEKLHFAAMQWDVRHGGRSPRSARQFIASLSVEE